MKRLILLAVLCLLSLAGVVGGRSAFQSYTSIVADARAARAATADATHTADVATATATQLRAVVDTLTRASHRAVIRADSLGRVVAHFKSARLALLPSLPDTCRPALALSDSIISAQDTVIVALRGAHTADSLSVQRLTIALDTTTAALWNLRAAAVELSHADAALEATHRASWFARFARILPKTGVGGTAGLDVRGKPNATIGVTMSWLF